MMSPPCQPHTRQGHRKDEEDTRSQPLAHIGMSEFKKKSKLKGGATFTPPPPLKNPAHTPEYLLFIYAFCERYGIVVLMVKGSYPARANPPNQTMLSWHAVKGGRSKLQHELRIFWIFPYFT